MPITTQRKEQAFAALRDLGFSDEEILEIRDSKPKQSRVNRSNFSAEILTLLETIGTITQDTRQGDGQSRPRARRIGT